MNRSSTYRSSAFTAIEILIVVATLALLFAFLVPMLGPRNRNRGRNAPRINCVSNLKQVALAMRIWSNDHQERFPWVVPTNQAGTLEFLATDEWFRHFQALSNELNSPKILACRSDANVVRATTFDSSITSQPYDGSKPILFTGPGQVSYFLGINADEAKPTTILAGDRNLTGVVSNGNHQFLVLSNSPPRWGKNMHNEAGNLALADGSVQQASNETLNKTVAASCEALGSNQFRIIIP